MLRPPSQTLECLCHDLFQSVSDDGCGFADAARSAGSSFGLVGMRERIQMLGGQLCIDSQPGEGTTITARVPLDPLPLPSPASTGALPS